MSDTCVCLGLLLLFDRGRVVLDRVREAKEIGTNVRAVLVQDGELGEQKERENGRGRKKKREGGRERRQLAGDLHEREGLTRQARKKQGRGGKRGRGQGRDEGLTCCGWAPASIQIWMLLVNRGSTSAILPCSSKARVSLVETCATSVPGSISGLSGDGEEREKNTSTLLAAQC
eukprot:3504367-Rhodomonas_salina.1